MFNSNSNNQSGKDKKGKSYNNQSPDAVNFISQNTTIKGEISTEGDIRIDGNLNGTLYSKAKVVIGETGHVTGDVFCQKADLAGKLEGSLYSDDLFHLKAKGVLTGNIFVHQLIIESGATFQGKCEMGENMVDKHQKKENPPSAKEKSADQSAVKTEKKKTETQH